MMRGPHMWQTRLRIAESVARYYASPEARAKASAGQKRRHADPERREAHRAALRRAAAKRAVAMAGLPLTRANVDRARALMDARKRNTVAVVAGLLKAEAA